MYKSCFTKQAQKDAKNIKVAGLKPKAERLLRIISANPYNTHPFYEKLIGDLQGLYSRRITIQHRLIYQIYEKEKIIKIIRMSTHYE